jgi:hypothetical protein
MKRIVPIVFTAYFLFLIVSCTKEQSSRSTLNFNGVDTSINNQDTISPTASIYGKWNLINDSLYVADAPPFFNAGDSVYVGTAADYYNFSQGISLYRRESIHTDTCSFELLPNNQVEFLNIYDYRFEEDSLGTFTTPKVSLTYTITTLTEHNLTLVANLSSAILTPEGYFANKIKLYK